MENEKITGIMKESKNFEKPLIKEDLYLCECCEVKRISEGKFGNRIAIVVKIDNTETELAFICYSDVITPLSKAGQAVTSFGLLFQPELEFDYSMLVGRKAKALVENYDAFDNQNNKIKVSGISKFMPLNQVQLVA